MPFTPESLIDTAIEQLAIYREGEGVRSRAQMDAHRLSEDAEHCAYWLAEFHPEGLDTVGPFGVRTDLKRGQRVMIRKGTGINTMAPKYRGRAEGLSHDRFAGRDHVVTVYRVEAGHCMSYEGLYRVGAHMASWEETKRRTSVKNQQVCYVGAGGYWCYVDAAAVEIVGEDVGKIAA